MIKKLALAISVLSLSSCNKNEETIPTYWVLKNYQDSEIVVKHLSNSDTLRINETIVVFNKPTFECLGTGCIVSINNKMKSVNYLGEY